MNFWKSRALGLLLGIALLAQPEVAVAQENQNTQGPLPIPPILSPRTNPGPEVIRGDFTRPHPIEEPKIFPARAPSFESQPGAIKGYVEGLSKEIAAERRLDAKIFANPDGTRTARVYAGPVHYVAPDGSLKDIDNRLLPDASGFRNGGGLAEIHFAHMANAPDLVTISSQGKGLTFSMEGTGPALAIPDGSSVRYSGVASGVDLEYRVGSTVLKEFVILTQRPSVGQPVEFAFHLSVRGVTPRQEQNGGMGFYDETGAIVFSIPPAIAWDSTAPGAEEGAEGRATLALSGSGADWTVTLKGDEAWLASPERRYPVYLDPVVEFGYGKSGDWNWHQDSFVRDGTGAGSNYNVWDNGTTYCGRRWFQDRVGFYDSTTGTNWTYMRYDLSFLNWRTIYRGTWRAYTLNSYYGTVWTDYWIHPVAGDWNAGTITWNNKPGVRVDTIQRPGLRCNWSDADMTTWVYNWTHGVWESYGIQLDAGGNGQTYWKKPASNENGDWSVSYIEVDYNTPPDPGQPISPTGNIHTITPRLTARAFDDDGDQVKFRFWVCEDEALTRCVWESGWTGLTNSGWDYSVDVPANVLFWNRTYWWIAESSDGKDGGGYASKASFFTGNGIPPTPSAAGPANDSIQTTTQPTLSVGPVSDSDQGDTVYYYFKISEAPDAQAGGVVESGWTTNNTWPVLRGALVDGRKYYWTASARDNNWARDGWRQSGWATPQSFKVDLGLGDRPSRGYDRLGAAAVNLSNGNLVLSTSSPTFSALGGALGLSYSYNSQTPAANGLRGYYYNDTNKNRNFDENERALDVRIDTDVNFNWGSNPPIASGPIDSDYFLIRWEGYVTVPAAGQYYFGRISDDGVRIWVDEQLKVDHWTPQAAPSTPQYGSPVSLGKKQTAKFRVEYFDYTGLASVQLWVKGPTEAVASGEGLLPASWFTTDLPGLPDGWQLSADPDGDLGYTYLRAGAGTAVVVDSTGATHPYNGRGRGGRHRRAKTACSPTTRRRGFSRCTPRTVGATPSGPTAPWRA